MNSRESPLGEVTNRGLSSPEATILVCKGGTAANPILANPVANKVKTILAVTINPPVFRAVISSRGQMLQKFNDRFV
jgi:hypothetical protein